MTTLFCLWFAGWMPAFAADAPAADSEADAPPPDEAGEVVVVTAERHEASEQDVPMSVAVVTGETIDDAAILHAEDVIQLVPNMDWVGASHRPRWLLIRGVGDLGTGNVVTNPSVGVLVDEIDLSGMGGALTMFDVERVEVLRGPQGTLYGPNALGGLVTVTSRAPTLEPEAQGEIRVGAYDSVTVRAAAGSRLVPTSDVVSFRAAAQYHRSDGFFDNDTLGRDDTAGRSELSTRLRFRIQPTANLRIDVTGSWIDVDDGYDHWSIFNSRTVYSDRPGRDAQQTGMGSVQIRWDAGPVRFVSNTSLSTSTWDFRADWDWFGVDTPRPGGSEAAEDYVTDLYNEQITVQDAFTQELRLQSRPEQGPWGDRIRWLGGLFTTGVRQQMSTETFWFGEPQDWGANASDYRRLAAAGFGQVDVTPVDRLTLTLGGRAEHAWQDYTDDYGADVDEARWLFGWRAAARVEAIDELSIYASVAQSSKLGGFNLAPDAPVPIYDPEVDRSYELGLRSAGRQGRWRANLTGFYIQRIGQQISEWVQRPGGDSGDIFFYTDNADRAYTFGGELEVAGMPVEGLTLQGSLGLLEARIAEWSFGTGDGAVDYSGKRHAHAPLAQWSVSAAYRHAGTGVFARVGVTGASERQLAHNNEISDPAYALLDGRLGWRGQFLGVSVWGRNLTDTRYAAAGFGPYFAPNEHVPFGNYYRWGDPATFGLSVEADL